MAQIARSRLRDGSDERCGFLGAGDAFAAASDCGEGKSLGGVDGDVAAVDRAAVDRPQRQHGVPRGARGGPGANHLVNEVLDRHARDG